MRSVSSMVSQTSIYSPEWIKTRHFRTARLNTTSALVLISSSHIHTRTTALSQVELGRSKWAGEPKSAVEEADPLIIRTGS